MEHLLVHKLVYKFPHPMKKHNLQVDSNIIAVQLSSTSICCMRFFEIGIVNPSDIPL